MNGNESPSEAVIERARVALHRMPGIECDHAPLKVPCCYRDASAAVRAAYGPIVAAERERIAQAIEAQWFGSPSHDYTEGVRAALSRAASIARTEGDLA